MQLISGLKTLSYTVTALTPGQTYNFEVAARNVYGNSVFSNIAIIMSA